MSKQDFEKRLTHGPYWIKDLYYRYQHVFADDLVSVYWFHGWSHIIEGMLRNFEKDLTDSDKYPGVGAIGDYPDAETYQGFGSAKHYNKKLSEIGNFPGFKITDMTMNVQIINR